MGVRALIRLLSCICALGVAMGAAAQSRQGHFADIGRIDCAEGAERYLPGDYYFCTANKALQAGNARKAAEMYEESAHWGDKRAMFNLGLLLLRGDGMPKDEPLGLAWLALAAERKTDTFQRQTLAAAWKNASPQVRDAANARWNSMKLEYADRYVLPRAQERYERETRQLRRDLLHDPSMRIQIAGVKDAQGGTRAIELLDQAAAETILRPLKDRLGTVTIGTVEMIRDAEKATKP